MGERKGQSKYYPPDFDPTRLPKQDTRRGHKVRMMMPMSVQCNTCAEYIYNGKKFNATIEPADEAYLGIKIWRLTVRCPKCANAISMKTDPQNCDYICESGATRNFEPWRQFNLELAEKDEERDDARKDVMKDLEAKQYDATKEMDQLNRLDELVSMSARRTGVTPENLLETLLEKAEEEKTEKNVFTEAEEAEVADFKKLQQSSQQGRTEDAKPVLASDLDASLASSASTINSDLNPGLLLKKKKKTKAKAPSPTVEPPQKKLKPMAGLGLDYGSD